MLELRLVPSLAVVAVVVTLVVASLAGATQNEKPAPWPSEKTEAPNAAAWQAAPALTLENVYGARAKACQVRRIAEWVNVKCPDLKASAITELGGSPRDVSYAIAPPGEDRVPGAGQVTFAARSGDRRVFLLWALGPGYDGPLTVVPAVVLQESWLAGSDAPNLVLTDALHEPVATKTHPRPPRSQEP